VVAVRLQNLTRKFGDVIAVNSVSLDIAEGELFFLLGPSGCGKTTILRTIAGFEEPDAGLVFIGGRDMTRVPAHERQTGMVFQNYALWPHMTVAGNVAYGLKVRKVDRSETERRVREALDMVRMSAEAGRYPNELSGGQQQRVALARALVIRPLCLLLDEPLSNLDAKLRLEMRAEIRRIHDETGTTTVYVTHDQKEALSMADRLAVVLKGSIVQIGSPEDVYRAPADDFVAGFIGETNLIPGTVKSSGPSGTRIDTALGLIAASLSRVAVGRACSISIRPEDIDLSDAPTGENSFAGRVDQYTFLGEVGQYQLSASGLSLKALVMAPQGRWRPGSLVGVTFPVEKVAVFPSSAGGAGA
jgi:iron(III) transport system ATP-binding protein